MVVVRAHDPWKLVGQDTCQDLTLVVARISLSQMKAITQLVKVGQQVLLPVPFFSLPEMCPESVGLWD